MDFTYGQSLINQAILLSYQKMTSAPYHTTLLAELSKYADVDAMIISFMADEKTNLFLHKKLCKPAKNCQEENL